MAVKIRMSDADRALYGGEEWLEWDPAVLRLSEAELLEELLGITVEQYQGKDGWLTTGGSRASKWVLWLCLRRSGVIIDWTLFDPDLFGIALIKPPETVAPAGKAPRRAAGRSAGAAKTSPRT